MAPSELYDQKILRGYQDCILVFKFPKLSSYELFYVFQALQLYGCCWNGTEMISIAMLNLNKFVQNERFFQSLRTLLFQYATYFVRDLLCTGLSFRCLTSFADFLIDKIKSNFSVTVPVCPRDFLCTGLSHGLC